MAGNNAFSHRPVSSHVTGHGCGLFSQDVFKLARVVSAEVLLVPWLGLLDGTRCQYNPL
jgi:hypothetical protein